MMGKINWESKRVQALSAIALGLVFKVVERSAGISLPYIDVPGSSQGVGYADAFLRAGGAWFLVGVGHAVQKNVGKNLSVGNNPST